MGFGTKESVEFYLHVRYLSFIPTGVFLIAGLGSFYRLFEVKMTASILVIDSVRLSSHPIGDGIQSVVGDRSE